MKLGSGTIKVEIWIHKERDTQKGEKERGRYYELIEMVRKLLLTALLVTFLSAVSH